MIFIFAVTTICALKTITLLSDLGTKDYTVSVWKASIIKQVPECRIIDISHQINPLNITEAYYVFSNSYTNFPKNTVHLIGMEAVYHKNMYLLIAKMNHQYFITTDNGLLSLLANFESYDFVKKYPVNQMDNFLHKNSFCNLLGKLNNSEQEIHELQNCTSFKQVNLLKPLYKTETNTLIGSIIYFDHFGNAITNIKKDKFLEYFNNQSFSINVNFRFIKKIYSYYEEIIENVTEKSIKFGELMALFNDNDFLEIAIYRSNLNTVGGASTLLGLNIGMEIKITKD